VHHFGMEQRKASKNRIPKGLENSCNKERNQDQQKNRVHARVADIDRKNDCECFFGPSTWYPSA